MFDAEDITTFHSLKSVTEAVASEDKPFLLWIGAGTSAWCGYDLWPQFANRMHSEYLNHDPSYDKNEAHKRLTSRQYPEFFELCHNSNSQLFHKLLVAYFSPKSISPVYKRFIEALLKIQPLQILTTNVDILLEKNLPQVEVIERSDIERISGLQYQRKSFVCKLHGSISNVESTVFTRNDYKKLLDNTIYSEQLSRIIGSSSIIFIGYSIQDEYVLKLLSENTNLNHIFGDGPHFAILSEDHNELPDSVKIIKYIPHPHQDHRESITVLEEIGYCSNNLSNCELQVGTELLRSAHLLFDVFPPGSWKISHTLNIESDAGSEKQIVVGTGFTDEELPNNLATAMHDVLVGLLCFDTIYAPINALARLHDLVGSQTFWDLIKGDILKIINWNNQEGIIFPEPDALAGGDLGSFALRNPDQTERDVGQIIREHLNPIPGNELVAAELFQILEDKTIDIKANVEGSIPQLVRSLLLRPSIRHLLGISEGTPLHSIARWQMFPILRLASVVKLGNTCRSLNISSAKFIFGLSHLAAPVFAEIMGIEWSDAAASFIVCGRYDADLGQLAIKDPTILHTIISFRNTEAGKSLRKAILSHLSASEGHEVALAIDGGLRTAVPSTVLQQARDKFINLLVSQPTSAKPLPAIWKDDRYAGSTLNLWKKHSSQLLEEYCRQNHIGQYDPCPCGSGEKLKFCCKEALSNV